MPIIAGIDGCKAGWLCITQDTGTGAIDFAVHPDLRSLFRQFPLPDVIAIDMPIGLTDAGPRQCDLDARRILGPRAGSVFPAPIRPALNARTRKEADRIRRQIDGRGVSAQSFNIYAKIRELDTLLQADYDLRRRVKEIHPELSFWAWNGKKPMQHPKRANEGQTERQNLIVQIIPNKDLAQVRAAYPTTHVANDDIHDACAALWTAQRIVGGQASRIPNNPPLDATGLPMQMWY